MSRPTVEPVQIEGRSAWLKRYGSETRRYRLKALDWCARRLGISALRPAPRHPGDAARAIEQRRIEELGAAGVRVPELIGSGEGLLVLGDLGETLSGRLRRASPAELQALLAEASTALSDVHERRQYLGQPVARNILVDAEGRLGFIDFEEDPAEVMGLRDAQARDWLLFASGTARHAGLPPEQFAELVGPALRRERRSLRDELGEAVDRLGFLRVSLRLGERAAGLGKALAGLQRALHALAWSALALGLVMGLAHMDEALELAPLLIELID